MRRPHRMLPKLFYGSATPKFLVLLGHFYSPIVNIAELRSLWLEAFA
jgi:hypothetical protein